MKCKQCDFETPMVSDFRYHMYLKHNAKKPNFHRCENCIEKFYNFDDLVIHREQGKCGVTDHGDLHDVGKEVQVTNYVNGKELDQTIKMPILFLQRLSAEIYAQHCKTVTSLENSQRIRVCVICKMQISHKNLLTHIRAMHVNFNTFKCTLCVKGFNDKTSLNNHILQHHTEIRPFLCNLCGAGFSARKYVVPHILGCLKNNWIKCNTAAENKQGSVDDYVKEMTGEVPCPMCKAVCCDYISLINHMKRHRFVYPGDKVKIAPFPEVEKKLHSCEVCSMKFYDLGKLVTHKRLHQLSTGVAAKRFRKKLKQSNHLKVKKSVLKTELPVLKTELSVLKTELPVLKTELPVSNGQGEPVKVNTPTMNGTRSPGGATIHTCNYDGCYYATNNEANMRRHKKCVHKEGGIEPNKEEIIHFCQLCPYETNQLGNLTRHVANKHDIGEIQKCDRCTFTAFSKEKLKNHMKSAHNVKPNTTCKNCNREFPTHHEMKCHQWLHLRNHTTCNGTPFVKSSKSKMKSTPSPFKATKTIKVEKNEEKLDVKFHICPQCGKSFIREKYLQKHIDCAHRVSDGEEESNAPPPVQIEESIVLPPPQNQTPTSDIQFLIEPEHYALQDFNSQQTRIIEIDAI